MIPPTLARRQPGRGGQDTQGGHARRTKVLWLCSPRKVGSPALPLDGPSKRSRCAPPHQGVSGQRRPAARAHRAAPVSTSRRTRCRTRPRGERVRVKVRP
eukprot:scaffold58148_cov32-Tisochrysis_lutea.AAC.1